MTFDYKSCPLKKRPVVYVEDENFHQYNTKYVNAHEQQSEALALIKSPKIELPEDLSINSSILNLSKHQNDTPLNLSINNKVFDSSPNYFHKKNDNVITHAYEYDNKAQTVNNPVTVRSFEYTSNQFCKSFITAAGCNPNNSLWNAYQSNLNTIYPSPNSSITSDVTGQSLYSCQQFSPPLSPKSEVISEPEDLSITKDIPLPALFHDLNENVNKNSPPNSSLFSYGYCIGYSESYLPDIKFSIGNGDYQTKSCRLKCGNCHKWYSSIIGLSKHQQFHCSPEQNGKEKKEFQCGECGKLYHTNGALKMHVRTHTLPCKCAICGKAFSRPWLLRGHIRTHTGEKPFKCPDCSRSFADRSNLKAHQQIHSNTKKYSCNHCSKTFSRVSLLKKHMNGICANTS